MAVYPSQKQHLPCVVAPKLAVNQPPPCTCCTGDCVQRWAFTPLQRYPLHDCGSEAYATSFILYILSSPLACMHCQMRGTMRLIIRKILRKLDKAIDYNQQAGFFMMWLFLACNLAVKHGIFKSEYYCKHCGISFGPAPEPSEKTLNLGILQGPPQNQVCCEAVGTISNILKIGRSYVNDLSFAHGTMRPIVPLCLKTYIGHATSWNRIKTNPDDRVVKLKSPQTYLCRKTLAKGRHKGLLPRSM